ncbi:MAG: cation:proton antiporter [Haloarculaceae archaeon]
MATPPLLEAGVVFAILAIGGALAARLDQSVIPVYILAGVAFGPHAPVDALALVGSHEFVDLLAELGIVLLLFFIGLEFNLERLVASRDRITRAGLIDVAVNGFVGLAFALLVGFSVLEALFVAGIVTISSSAVVTKSLVDLGWIADPEAEAVLGVLVFEDVVVAVYLALLAAVALGGTATGIAVSLGVSGGFVVALVLLAWYGTPLLERFLDVDADELFLLRIVAMAALLGGVALALGISEAVAAFFLGAAVGSTSHGSRIERVVTSERDLYAAVFFLSIGLATDLTVLDGVLLPLAGLVVVTTASKLVSGYLGGRAYGLSERRSVRTALALVARGEFSVVIAALAVQAGTTETLARTIPALAVGYVLAMSVLGTLLMRYSAAFEGLVADAAPA